MTLSGVIFFKIKIMVLSFKRSERLKSKKLIEETFNHGFSTFAFPFKTKFKEISKNQYSDPKILISIPKKKVKTAVGRNRIKRITREVYRLNNQGFKLELQELNLSIAIEFIFIGDENITHQEIYRSLSKHFAAIIKQCN